MDLADRMFIASLLTLALLVLVLERRNRMTAAQIQPPAPNDWNIRDINIPRHRGRSSVIIDAAYTSSDSAADASNE